MATATRRDVERVKTRDRDFPDHQNTLMARMAAVVGAQWAIAAGETGARFALRQALVDLSAISELIAADMSAPSIERVQGGRRAGWNIGA